MFNWVRLTIFHVIYMVAVVSMTIIGISFGWMYGGVFLAAIGAIIGALAGHVISSIPPYLAHQSMIKEIEKSSNEKLREKLNDSKWNLYQTMALLQLGARDVDIDEYLPRILNMLKSDDQIERRFGWDALRLVFTDKAEKMKGYDPMAPPDISQKYVVLVQKEI